MCCVSGDEADAAPAFVLLSQAGAIGEEAGHCSTVRPRVDLPGGWVRGSLVSSLRAVGYEERTRRAGGLVMTGPAQRSVAP